LAPTRRSMGSCDVEGHSRTTSTNATAPTSNAVAAGTFLAAFAFVGLASISTLSALSGPVL